jgi:hypothetical protein
MAMAKVLEENGTVPVGVDTPEVYRQRSGEAVIPRSQDWWDAYTSMRKNWQTVNIPRTVGSKS